jgi:hypothetical protein
MTIIISAIILQLAFGKASLSGAPASGANRYKGNNRHRVGRESTEFL